jgi:Lambda phage tail tape-measure protein (Tape_meas_lam_C)
MTQGKQVSIRLGLVGGKEVVAQFEQLGNTGSTAMRRLGDSATQNFGKVTSAGRGMGGGLQNVGYQVQDFAVQVAGGTSATRAMAQQLPQLLSGFGLWGVALGTVSAILIPLAGHLFGVGKSAETAKTAVSQLTASVNELKKANDVYSTAGIEGLIEKYGELDAKILTLVAHQTQFALDKAMLDARTSAAGLEGGLDGVLGKLHEYDSYTKSGATNPEFLADARDAAQALQDEFGLTVDEARALKDTLDAVRGADTIGEMADATAKLTVLIEKTSLKGSEFAGTLLESESALRQLNHEGSGIGGWLGMAIGWAKGLADQLWSGAAATAAIRNAQLVKSAAVAGGTEGYAGGAGMPVNSRLDTLYANSGGRAQGSFVKPGETRLPGGQIPFFGPTTTSARGTGGGGGASAVNQLEQQAKKIFDDTRTSAEKYAVELAELNKIKEAGLITGDTYNRQVDALGEKYDQQVNVLTTIQTKLSDFAAEAKNSGKAIGDAITGAFDRGADAVAEFVRTGKLNINSFIIDTLADFAKLSAKRYIFGPLSDALSGALGGGGGGGLLGKLLGGGGAAAGVTATILHEGGMAGIGGGSRSVPASVFAGAKRYHGGGLAGDEVAAILLKGERVLDRQETRAYDSGKGWGGGAPTINLNVKDAASFRQSRTQIAADLGRFLAAGQRAK